jgi:hypothetical protein
VASNMRVLLHYARALGLAQFRWLEQVQFCFKTLSFVRSEHHHRRGHATRDCRNPQVANFRKTANIGQMSPHPWLLLLHPPTSPPPRLTPLPSLDMLSLLTSPSSTVFFSPVPPPPTLSSTLEQPITWSRTGTSFPTYRASLNLRKSLSATALSSRLHNQGHSIYHTSPWTTCSSSQVSVGISSVLVPASPLQDSTGLVHDQPE